MGGWSCVVGVSLAPWSCCLMGATFTSCVKVDALKAQQAPHKALCAGVVRDALEVHARGNEALRRMLDRLARQPASEADRAVACSTCRRCGRSERRRAGALLRHARANCCVLMHAWQYLGRSPSSTT
ncbi:hypothetical protein AB1Y20_016221 [Prymnesium parvum]|uniref:Secreted protein n=1 Tax=Prymnesium parvum TaxID=97485 RepID=A0AB34IE55_PRYPA